MILLRFLPPRPTFAEATNINNRFGLTLTLLQFHHKFTVHLLMWKAEKQQH